MSGIHNYNEFEVDSHQPHYTTIPSYLLHHTKSLLCHKNFLERSSFVLCIHAKDGKGEERESEEILK